MTPLNAALVAEARGLAARLEMEDRPRLASEKSS